MELGFDTIGNATLVAWDRIPVVATDPWLEGAAYFGSWGHSHEIPREQYEAVRNAKYVWISHGHPDHLNASSIDGLGASRILLADHAGGRIARDLTERGFHVQTLPEREWISLSERIRVLTLSDYNQDSILLLDIAGRLAVNINDAADRGWMRTVRGIVRHFKKSFLLGYAGWGDADMMNFFDERGERIIPEAAQKPPVGLLINRRMAETGTNHFIPFSAMHRYQRTDSVWANAFIPTLGDFTDSFDTSRGTLLPAFIRYDCVTDTWSELCPAPETDLMFAPEAFGDNWTDTLDSADVDRIRQYLLPIQHLRDTAGYVTFRVGGRDHTILLNRTMRRGVTFAVPRASLMTALEYRVFDDLLIGNFMRTTLHGDWPKTGLYPDFTPYVAKYADNGQAYTREQLEAYIETYRRRAPVDFARHRISQKCEDIFRGFVNADSLTYHISRKAWRTLRRIPQ